MGSPGKVRAVVFRRQPVSWLPSCEKGPHSSCHVASRPAYPGPPSPLPSSSLSGKGWKSWAQPQSFVSPAQPPPSCWRLCRSSQNMRTLFEKGFTAHFKTQDWNSIHQSGGVFMIGSSLKKAFSMIFIKERTSFLY